MVYLRTIFIVFYYRQQLRHKNSIFHFQTAHSFPFIIFFIQSELFQLLLLFFFLFFSLLLSLFSFRNIITVDLVYSLLPMRWYRGYILLTLQLSFFLLARIFDDLSWYEIDFDKKQDTFQGISIAALLMTIILNIYRKRQIDGILKILLFKSQIKFLIPWALEILTVTLFFNTFGCTSQMPENQNSRVFLFYYSCCINGTQLILTNFVYSLAINTKTHIVEFVVYEIVLFAQIIFDARLLLEFIRQLSEKQKDLSLLLMTVTFTNQIMIMDLIFRGAFQGRELEEEEQKLSMEISLVNDHAEVVAARKMTAGIKMVDIRPNTFDHKIIKH